MELVAADRLGPLKRQILDAVGLGVSQKFPLFLDRFPSQVVSLLFFMSCDCMAGKTLKDYRLLVDFGLGQLLTYTRLVRLQDPGLFAKIVFEKDVVVDQVS